MLIKCVTFNYKTTEHEWGPLSFSSPQQKDSPTELMIWILSSDVEWIHCSLSRPDLHLRVCCVSGPYLVKYSMALLLLEIPCWIPSVRSWELQLTKLACQEEGEFTRIWFRKLIEIKWINFNWWQESNRKLISHFKFPKRCCFPVWEKTLLCLLEIGVSFAVSI